MTNEQILEQNTKEMTLIDETINSSHHYEHFYQDPTFWVAMSFVLVVAALAKPMSKIIYNLLGKRITSIVDNIKEANKLEIDAKKLLKEYEQKVAHLEKEVADILEKSKKEIAFIREKNIKSLDDELNRKKQENAKFLSNMQEQAQKEINDLIAEKVINAVKDSAQEKLDDSSHNKLIDTSIANIEKMAKN